MLSCYDAEGLKIPIQAERIEFSATMYAARDKTKPKSRTEVVYRRLAKAPPQPGLKLFDGTQMQ